MSLVTGYAFNTKHIFENFPIHKLKITRQQCKQLFGELNRRTVAIRIFLYAVKVILLDIIHNNVTFKLPTKRECYIYIKRTHGEDFMRARRNGKWQDVDFLASNFSGYQMEFKYIAKERSICKPIHVSRWMRDLLTKYTNEGKQYY